MSAVVTASHNAASILRVYINDTLHLLFSTENLASVQAWSRSHSRSPAKYCIEITPTAGAATLAEYDNEVLWRAVLSAIDRSYGRMPDQGAGVTVGEARE